MILKNIKDNIYYFRIINIYAVILGIVYGYWFYTAKKIIWASLLIGFGIILLGAIIAFIYVHMESKKNNQETLNE
ncbi:MAG: hypothetical protein ACI35W_03155 [Anaeroplasmataceae bacterium]